MNRQNLQNVVRPMDRICVLGAGAAGLSLARELEDHGYRNVTVLERQNRVGGKCCTVELAGRPHDMGAVGGTPWLYRDFRKLARSVGVQYAWAPYEKEYSLESGEIQRLHTVGQKLGLVREALRYVALRMLAWKGARVSGITTPPEELHQTWETFVRTRRLQKLSERLRDSRIGFGYGFDDATPAVYPVTCTDPRGVLGSLVGTGLYYWPGGTQTVWEKVAVQLRDVRTGIRVQKIGRGDGIRVMLENGDELTFDFLVVAFNPRDALGFLDVDEQERSLFERVQTLDYRSVACHVDGLDDDELGIGFIQENLKKERVGRPVLWTKQYKDQNVLVFYLYGTEGLTDKQAFEHIRDDVARLGGEVVGEPLLTKHWDYFPHVDSAALADDFYEKMDALQGHNRTFYTGSYLTFEAIAFALANGRKIARKMMGAAS